jgi:predicted nucleic acid-binding protein
VGVIVIFDTDLLIWLQRGNLKAGALIEKTNPREISIFTYMELLQGASNKMQHMTIKNFLSDFEFVLLPITESIGHRALVYVEEYSLSHGLQAADAIIAATAIEHNAELVSGNAKHFKCIQELKLHIFKP